jgi:sugar phosphate isomerase/epimerase
LYIATYARCYEAVSELAAGIGIECVIEIVPDDCVAFSLGQLEFERVTRSVPPEDLVVSNVCWNPAIEAECLEFVKSKGIDRINVAFSMHDPTWASIDVHRVRAMRLSYEAVGIRVHSVNAVFYERNENLFLHYPSFVSHFRKMVQLTSIIGASALIYGSGSSRFINATHLQRYQAYKQAHCSFVAVIKELATVAKNKNVTMYIKPNTKDKCNYLNEQHDVDEMVNVIDIPDVVKAAPMRCGAIVDIDHGFALLEYQGKGFTDFATWQAYFLLLTSY